MIKHLSYLIATGLGSGWLPYAPGTWGSIVGALMAYPILIFSQCCLGWFTLIAFFVGWIVSEIVIREVPNDPDPSFIVIDEIVGLAFTVWLLMQIQLPYAPFFLIFLAFAAFRLFDIWKPFPISWLDDTLSLYPLTKSFGIMIDDMAAGLMAAMMIGSVYKIIACF